jgi:O-antigen ligase
VSHKRNTSPLEFLSFSLILGIFTGWAFWSIDPFNALKLSILTSIAFAMLFLIFRKPLINNIDRPVQFILLIFISISTLTFIFSNESKATLLFGIFGRNTGYLTYLSLCIVLIAFYTLSDSLYLKKFINLVGISSIFVLAAGFLQVLDIGPQALLSNNDLVFGFSGNTNFFSSLLGIIAILAAAPILNRDEILFHKFFYVLVISTCVYLIYETDSIQGYFVILAGVSSLIFLLLLRNRNKLYFFAYSLIIFLTTVVVSLGFLKIGPFSSRLYNLSITDRGYCWKSAIETWQLNPVLGVGFDGYQNWFRRTRSLDAIRDKGLNGICDSAHNVFLDFLVNGGLILFFTYLVLVVYTLSVVIRVTIREDLNINFLIISSGWVGYQIQSLISINHLTLATLGWSLMGLILGYGSKKDLSSITAKDKTQIKIDNKSFTKSIIGFIIGLSISIQPQLLLNRYQSAYSSGDANVLHTAVKSWPNEMFMMNLAGSRFKENNLFDYELSTSLEVVKRYPDSYNAWRSIYNSSLSDLKLKNTARINMLRLDPFNTDLK